jgi:predicted secreted hydrolase
LVRTRRAWLLAALGSAAPPLSRAQAVAVPRELEFPRDHGAHVEFGIEWWYATGWLRRADDAASEAPAWGFQLTFFRSRTGLAEDIASRFAARQLLFAHAALSDAGQRRLVHAERLARWNGDDERASTAAAASADTRVHIGDWRFARDAAGGRYAARLADEAAGFGFDFALQPVQPLLLQGDRGLSRKGPRPDNASHYYSWPQLDVSGTLRTAAAQRIAVRGRAWLDHEWSGSLMPDGAVGWDWIGFNLDDGGALTAFRLRDRHGASLWAGGSHRTRDGHLRTFAAGEVTFEPLAHWTSPATRAQYATRWRVRCPAGLFEVRAVFDAQELDGRATTGTVYWEGLSSLHVADGGARIGWGYLEMTGYAGALRL